MIIRASKTDLIIKLKLTTKNMKKRLTILTALVIASTCLQAKNPITIKNGKKQKNYVRMPRSPTAFVLACLIPTPDNNENSMNIQNDSAPFEWKTYTNDKYGSAGILQRSRNEIM